MRFADLLRSTVLISAAAASALALATIAAASGEQDTTLVTVALGWWIAAFALGTWLGRPAAATPAIARVLADARNATALPEVAPARILLNRLWPLLFGTIAAGAVAFAVPQAAMAASGFCAIWALAWRRQSAAVTAIEERDGVTFYVEPTSPLRPIKLTRTPGFKRERPVHHAA